MQKAVQLAARMKHYSKLLELLGGCIVTTIDVYLSHRDANESFQGRSSQQRPTLGTQPNDPLLHVRRTSWRA
jgi:hypothetical protein